MTDEIKKYVEELMEDINKLQVYSTGLTSTTHYPTIISQDCKFDGKWYFKREVSHEIDTLNRLFCIAQLYDNDVSVKLLESIFTYSKDETDELVIKFNAEISDQVKKELLENELIVMVIKHRIAQHQSMFDTRTNIKRLKEEALELQKAAKQD